MSEPDHAEILRSGPRAWNAWREKNPSTIPDLSGIALKLSERQMGQINGGPINLKSARLQDAFLRFATLSAANFEAADMSGADLVHARFDQANLSAANLSNALLDYADFAGANLQKVNLCGASLHHAKNLTQAQLEESIGSNSAILPQYLRESVSWSVAGSQTETTALKRRDLRPRARYTTDADCPRISSSNRPAWIVGVLLIGGALVCTGFFWQPMNHAVPLDTSGAQRESEGSLPAPKLSRDPGDEGLQPSAPEALMEKKAAAERRPSDDVEIPPSAASAVDRTEAIPLDTSGAHEGLQLNAPEALMEEKAAAERRLSADPEAPPKPPVANTADRVESAPGERPDLEKGGQTVPQDANAHTELQAFDGARPPSEAFGPYEHAPGSPEEGHASKSDEASEASAIVSAASPLAASRHGTVTVPDIPAEASEASALVAAESLVSTSRHGIVPDLPTQASMTTPEHSSASSFGERLQPSVVTAPLPSSVIPTDVRTVLPPRTETPPTPVRNPARQQGAKGQNSVDKKPEALAVIEKGTVLPSSEQTPPTPVRNPAR